MKASSSAGRITNPVYVAGLLMPYLTVGAGLYIFHNAWIAILGYHAGILLILKLAHFKSSASFRPTAQIWKTIGFGALGGLAGLAMWFLWPYVFMSPSLAWTVERWGLTRAAWPLFIAYSALVNPWLEELYWRGWLGSASRRPVVNDAFFAGFHLVILAPFLPGLWLAVVFFVLAAAGWMWREVTRHTDSLLLSALCHLAADVSILLVIVSEIT